MTRLQTHVAWVLLPLVVRQLQTVVVHLTVVQKVHFHFWYAVCQKVLIALENRTAVETLFAPQLTLKRYVCHQRHALTWGLKGVMEANVVTQRLSVT